MIYSSGERHGDLTPILQPSEMAPFVASCDREAFVEPTEAGEIKPLHVLANRLSRYVCTTCNHTDLQTRSPVFAMNQSDLNP